MTSKTKKPVTKTALLEQSNNDEEQQLKKMRKRSPFSNRKEDTKMSVSLVIISAVFVVLSSLSISIGAATMAGADRASEFFSDINRGLITDYQETVPEAVPRVLALPPAPGTCFECGKTRLTYSSWSTGTEFTGTRYAGRFVAILVPDEWPGNNGFTEEEIRFLLDRLDIVYQHAYELIRQEPSGSGLLEVLFTDISYFGFGWLGQKHLEIINADWAVDTIRASLQRGQLHVVFPHEMMHNFDFFWLYLKYSPMDAHAWTDFIQGYLMYYSGMGRAAGELPAHQDLPADQFIEDWQRRTWEPYLFLGRLLAEPVMVNEQATWEFCIRNNLNWESCRPWGLENANFSWGGLSNAIGLLHGPDAIKNTFDFLRDYVDNNPPPVLAEDKEDLHIEALAAGTGVNLGCYVDAWRWHASDALRGKMTSLYGSEAPLCNDSDGDGFSVIYGDCDDTDSSVHPGASEQSNGIDDNCDGTIDNRRFVEPDGLGFPNPQPVTLPTHLIGRVESGFSDTFTFQVNQLSPMSIELCSTLDLVGSVRVFDPNGGEFGDFHGVDHNCLRKVYEIDKAGEWRVKVLGNGGYAMIVKPVDPWPIPWGRIEDPVIEDQGNSVSLTAVTESIRYVAEAPDSVRFWISGYGFVGSVPYETTAVFDWTLSPPMLLGSYSVRAQLMKGERPVSDVTPANVFRCDTCPEVPPPLPSPSNDDFADATELLGASGNVQGTNALATTEPGEPQHAGVPGGASVWWEWTAPADGQATFDTFGSNFRRPDLE